MLLKKVDHHFALILNSKGFPIFGCDLWDNLNNPDYRNHFTDLPYNFRIVGAYFGIFKKIEDVQKYKVMENRNSNKFNF